MPDDQRLVLARMHALAVATLTASDARTNREYLSRLAHYAPDPIVLAVSDPRSDDALAAGIEPIAVSRRFAARVRGVVLGAAVHDDAVPNEVAALAWASVRGEGVVEKELKRRVTAALKVTREDLAQDVVRLAWEPVPADIKPPWVQRWGGVRSLELNAFVAAFTRDGTHPVATEITRDSRDARALRFVLAVSQAAMSLQRDVDPAEYLVRDIRITDAVLPALIAALAKPMLV